MELYAYQLATFVVICLFVSEITSLCCHLPYMQSLPCNFESKSVSELKLLEPTDEGREVGMPSSMEIMNDMIKGLCSYSMCSPGYIKKKGNVFCSTGSCNMFGCNCDGECINNKYVDDYLQRLRQENNNTNLTYEHLSRAKRSIYPRSKNTGMNVNSNPHSQPSYNNTLVHNPPGSSVGYNHERDKHNYDYNGDFKMPIYMMADAKKLGSITGNIARNVAIDLVSTLTAEYVSKNWLFPEPNKVNDTALITILKEYNATLNEIFMKFNKPFDQLNSTQQAAFVHKAQLMNLISSVNNRNAIRKQFRQYEV
ncbi:uncharacterized protein LOC112691484 [Sipha flava]|jgi:hypothetical protein|uniref:Uncharacterized protein LOC112691484 n=1 Tax=Sipha flava TaxID=143950 RepID=A0A2S2QPH4_9HEMI|nr:uncharacterized protein LOC112691484 [Sipha flava]